MGRDIGVGETASQRGRRVNPVLRGRSRFTVGLPAVTPCGDDLIGSVVMGA